VARDLGVRVKDLYRWRHEFADAPTQAFPGKGRRTTRDEEFEQMKRRAEQAELEVEILKKATAFFARPCLKGSRS
jgi:transposase